MRFFVVILLAPLLVSAVSVIKRYKVIETPPCAQTCPPETDMYIDPCTRDDIACLCLNKNYMDQVSNCIQGACSKHDAKKGLEAVHVECEAFAIDNPEKPFPKCGASCLKKSPTSCDRTDKKCLCTDNGYLEEVVSCFNDSCDNYYDLWKAKYVGEAFCRTAGVDISSIFG